MKRIYLTFLFCLIFSTGYSQEAPIKYGKVSMDELKMNSCYLDSTASAVILCDYGYFEASDIRFTRILRIKILKKEGYNWANHEFPTDDKTSIRGLTTNLEDGKIVQTKLKNESVFKTRIVNNSYIMKVAMPNVKEGSIIDLEFTFHGIPNEWRFQEEIPVILSELVIEDTPKVGFRTNFYGYEKLRYVGPNKWIARDMPAFKDEPLMTSSENYLSKLKIDIIKILNYNFNSSWNNVNELLLDDRYFGMPGSTSFYLNDITKKISDRYKNREDQLKAAYDTIRERMVWNNQVQVTTTDGNLSRVFKVQTGNSAEVNLLLYTLLKKLDFDVTPVVLSTRENGAIFQFFPSLKQLNYVIVDVKIGETYYLLDATEKFMPFYLLPVRCLNVDGRLVDKKIDIWFPITNSKKDKDLALFDLQIDKNHGLKGDVSYLWSDYSAFNFRKDYSKFNSQDEYVESYLKNMPGLTVKNITFENLDSIYKPVSEKMTVEIQNQVRQIDNDIYIVPQYFEAIRENPFKAESRKYPVDYGVPIDKTVILNLKIPEGYAISSLPSSVTLKMPDKSATFVYDLVSMDNMIKLTTRFLINKVTFLPDEYNELKEFYNQVIKKQSESIVLKIK